MDLTKPSTAENSHFICLHVITADKGATITASLERGGFGLDGTAAHASVVFLEI